MSKTWVIADPHFGHANILSFKDDDGNPIRPFSSVEEMDKTMLNKWNERVSDEDRVYVLGDVAMNKKGFLGVVPYLKGRKVLVKGNHDVEKLSFYSQWFDDIRAYEIKKGYIMSHIPIHEGSMGRWAINIHGHIHQRSIPDKRYVCVSVEHTDYAPVDLQTLIDKYVK